MLGEKEQKGFVAFQGMQDLIRQKDKLFIQLCERGLIQLYPGILKQQGRLGRDQTVADVGLVLKIQIERSFGDTGFLDDIGDGGIVKAVGDEQVKSGIQQILFFPRKVPPYFVPFLIMYPILREKSMLNFGIFLCI